MRCACYSPAGTTLPWCQNVNADVLIRPASIASAKGDACDGAWHPEEVHVYLARATRDQLQVQGKERTAYNNFVIDGQAWDAALPHPIEAFLAGGHAGEMHAAFVHKFRLQGVDLPLLGITKSVTAPFVDLTEAEEPVTNMLVPENLVERDQEDAEGEASVANAEEAGEGE